MNRITQACLQYGETDLSRRLTHFPLIPSFSLTGVKGYISGKLKIKGNLLIAQQLEGVFNRAGGQEKAVKFIEANQPELAAVAKKKMKAKL